MDEYNVKLQYFFALNKAQHFLNESLLDTCSSIKSVVILGYVL